MRHTAFLWGAVVAVVVVLQLTVGHLSAELFALPLNLLVMALWLVGVWWLARHRHTSNVASMLHSMEATWFSLALLVVLGIAFGVQYKPATTSFLALASLLFVMTHLTLITLRGARNGVGQWRWSFLLNHCGLLLALVAGFWGSADRREWRVVVAREPVEQMVYTSSGSPSHIEYPMWLRGLRTEHFDNGTLAFSEALVDVDGCEVSLQVNRPYNRTWYETIYLTGYDTATASEARYVTLEVVRDWWRWPKFAGIVMLILGALMMFTGRNE